MSGTLIDITTGPQDTTPSTRDGLVATSAPEAGHEVHGALASDSH